MPNKNSPATILPFLVEKDNNLGMPHPMSAGAYVYGRTRQRRRPDGRVGREHLPGEEWLVTIRDHHPAYITWDRYERNRTRLAGNRRTARPGPERAGVGWPGGSCAGGAGPR